MDVYGVSLLLIVLAFTANASSYNAARRKWVTSHKQGFGDLVRKETKKDVAVKGLPVRHHVSRRQMYYVATAQPIMSPGYLTGSYDSYVDDSWLISAPAGQKIRLSLVDLVLESHSSCMYDYIRLYDGADVDWAPLLSTLCGKVGPFVYYSSSENMLLVFHSDYAITEKGFLFDLDFIPPTDVEDMLVSTCVDSMGTVMSQAGVIVSPEYGFAMYPNNFDCIWNINAPAGQYVQLDFESVALETSRQCEYDLLEISDTDSEYLYCSDDTPSPIISSSNSLQVVFHSDFSVQHAGFLITVSFTDQGPDTLPAISEPCPGPVEITLTDSQSLTIYSPGYDEGKYYHSSRCFWEIRAPAGSTIELTVLELQIENGWNCIYDVLQVYEGPSLRAFLCGSTLPSDTVVSLSNELTVEFFADYTANEGYWKLRVETISNDVDVGIGIGFP